MHVLLLIILCSAVHFADEDGLLAGGWLERACLGWNMIPGIRFAVQLQRVGVDAGHTRYVLGIDFGRLHQNTSIATF